MTELMIVVFATAVVLVGLLLYVNRQPKKRISPTYYPGGASLKYPVTTRTIVKSSGHTDSYRRDESIVDTAIYNSFWNDSTPAAESSSHSSCDSSYDSGSSSFDSGSCDSGGGGGGGSSD